MKTLAIIGASYLQRPLVEKAKDMGLSTICFSWPEGAVCSNIADKYYPVSIIEKDKILKVCKEERIDGICTIASDVAAPTVAYVAQAMHLNGNSFIAAVRANNKYLMRKAFTEGHINSPQYCRVTRGDKVDLSDWHFPLIVKPCDRSGSLGVMRVNSHSELREEVARAQSISFTHEAIVEEFIEGREISVECISYKGKHYPLAITDKVTTGNPHFVELEHHQPAILTPMQYEGIYSITKKALDALEVTDGASHTEFLITEQGEVFIVELGARMGGDFIGSDLVRLSTGYDFVKGVIEVALGEFNEPVIDKRAYSGVYFLSEETKHLLFYFNTPERVPGLVKIERTDSKLKRIQCSADRSGYIIYQSDKKVVL